jgi:hypothetical protein
MKIAVCISGQSRTWKVAKENILKYFDVGAEVDYFIHTWDTNSYRESGETVQQKTDYKIDNSELQELNEFFKPKKFVVDAYDIDKYARNWNSLFYSFMKSVWLKRKYELENDFKYDIVIKTRFDINFLQTGLNKYGHSLSKFYIHPIIPMNAYCANSNFDRFPVEFNNTIFDDVIFYSDSETMDLISNVYRWNKEIVDRGTNNREIGKFIEDMEYYIGPGALLYKHMINWNIYPTSKIVIPYYVVRKEALDKNLHSLNDWKQIMDISKHWYDAAYVADAKNKLI